MQTLIINNPMKISNIKCKLIHQISTMAIRGSYMCEFSVGKDMYEPKLMFSYEVRLSYNAN